MYCELGRYKNALICIQAVASFHRNAQFFFLFLSFLLFSMHVHVLFSRATTCAITYHRARWNVHEYSHMRRLHACPFERVRGSWNSMGTCAYGDGRVTCLPSGPCKHETTLGVETPRETIAIFAYFTRLTLYIYIYIYNVCCTPFATLPSNTHFEGNQHSCTTLQTVRNETKRVKRIRFINLSVLTRFHR